MIDYTLKDNTSALELGANVNRKSGGYTPLHTAVSFGYLEGVKILLECPDTQANLLNSGGDSALDLARKNEFGEIERILLPHFK
ncbi:MAG: ankyrin repeat domain-containing protein [Simkania sp.]|nr:ankyrin repeat domain-containing protein [Simkania sp.]